MEKHCILCGQPILIDPIYVELSEGFNAPIHHICEPRPEYLKAFFGINEVTLGTYSEILSKAKTLTERDIKHIDGMKNLRTIRLSRDAKLNAQAWLLEHDRTTDYTTLDGLCEALIEYSSSGNFNYMSPFLHSALPTRPYFTAISVPIEVEDLLEKANWLPLPAEDRLQRVVTTFALQLEPSSVGKALLRSKAAEYPKSSSPASLRIRINTYKFPKRVDKDNCMSVALSVLANTDNKDDLLRSALLHVEELDGHTTASVSSEQYEQLEGIVAQTKTSYIQAATALILLGLSIIEGKEMAEVVREIKEEQRRARV